MVGFAVRMGKRESSLRRERVIRADRAGSGPTGWWVPGRAWSASPRRLFRRMAVRVGKWKSSLRREKVVWADRAGSGLTGESKRKSSLRRERVVWGVAWFIGLLKN